MCALEFLRKHPRGLIYRMSYDSLTTNYDNAEVTIDGRLIYKTSYEGRKAFLGCDLLAKW